MAYKFSETNKVNDEFTKVFGIGFKPFYDGLVSIATKQLWIDIVKFDEWLHKKHGNYEDSGKSMMDVVREHYGNEGARLVDALTGEDDDDDGPKSELIERDGIKTRAERTVSEGQVTYKPYGNYHKGLDVNQVVYDLMTIAAQEMLGCGTAVYGGDYTAAEMAGTVGCLHQFMEGSDYELIKIQTSTYCCSYRATDVFAQMAEWEGVMNLSPKNYRRFHCEGKEMPKDMKLKPYQRCHGYKPRTISLAAENARIAKKFEVLGPMSQSLTSEGMRKALSVLTAIESIKKLHGYDMADLASRLLRRKLWRDYGRDQYQQPVCYSARDFEHGPEVWKQVDEGYVKQLIAYFRQVLADSPAPKWIKVNDPVQLKDQEKQPKKWQGKLSVWRVTGSLNYYKDAIEWFADVCTTKGKHDTMTRRVDYLEPWVEPDKPKKKAATKKQAKKASGTNNSEVGYKQSASCLVTTAEPTLADRLREALLKQLRVAA
ncbi:MAG: hypothetical protein IJ551_09845 [Prevotella sp.]|nr:hypothetical protein [Prevotella sp.]